MLSGTPLAASCRDRLLVTAFRSPATAAAFRRPPFRGQSSRPATSLPSRSFPCPFGLRLHRASGCVRLRPLQCLRPVALPLPGSACRAHRLHSPSGLLLPSGSKRSTVCCLPVHLPNPPDFPSLPAAVLFEGMAADQRSRSATFPPACCSSNLLEPSSLCSRSQIWSMPFRCGTSPFPQHLFGLLSDGYGDWLVHPVWIKRLPVILFLRYCNRKCAGLSYAREPSATSSSPSPRSSAWP